MKSLDVPFPNNAYVIRPAMKSDIEALVAVHIRAFPGFFLTFLGRRFLHQLYSSIVADRSGSLWVAFEKDRLLGFVAGTLEPAGFYARLARERALRFAFAAAGALLLRPSILPRLLRAFRKPAESKTIKDRTALLMSIAVEPDAQGRSVGKGLIEAFCSNALSRGARVVCLTTDQCNNDAVNGFYLRHGFILSHTFITSEGRRMNEYSLQLISIDEKPLDK